ncbi:hypothetical protein IW140_006192 [Coemansia sp. RSA 1813]|nr:Essential protein Yae1, N terminal [Coemansia sp. RSA 1646]KAJ1766534.1 hypothetical protein LPJ74_005836 [Coemansia sp. RSA 1843]KAJ2092244.1 hypothetical protein IW138_001312 [Coemansia sp. RSA 986]KAJ2211290.1 hypothetical protein EV179_005600 [Coemansia sp. RSA 487]KAJ2563196.1 hypothetical protein IW140_006192 [Coemansia sp. RSA 1813]
MSSSDDDIWDSESRAGEQTIGARSLQRLERTFHTTGYSDGIEASKHENMQQGFDHGIDYALPHGRVMGQLLGSLVAQREILKRADPLSPLIASSIDPLVVRLRAMEWRSVVPKDYASGIGASSAPGEPFFALVRDAQAVLAQLSDQNNGK